jgi:hypothetical protein
MTLCFAKVKYGHQKKIWQLVERYYPEFTASSAEQGRYLPEIIGKKSDT